MSSDAISTILGRLQVTYKLARQVMFQFGDAVLALREHGLTWKDIGSRIREALPNAANEIGFALSDNYLRTAARAVELFHSEDGLVSPDGKHQVTRDQFDNLPLSKAQREEAINLLAFSESDAHLKGAHKLRVSDIASAVEGLRKAGGDTAKRQAAIDRLTDRIDEVRRSYEAVAHGGARGVLVEQVRLADDKLTKARAAVVRAEQKLAEAQAELAEHDRKVAAEREAAEVEAAEAPAPKPRKGKGGRSQATAIQAAAN